MKDKQKTVIMNALAYMQSMDGNGTWEEASEDVAHGEVIETHDIQYVIDTLKEWLADLMNDTDKEAERMKKDMQGWIERLESVK